MRGSRLRKFVRVVAKWRGYFAPYRHGYGCI
jgi:hypothetical protein